MVTIFLVRHGQASFHSADYDQLSDTGTEQARLLGEWFGDCDWPVHHVVTGGMKRHLQTAEGFFSIYPRAGDWTDCLNRDACFNEFDHKEILERSLAAEDPEAIAKGFQFGHMTPDEFNVKMPKALLRWAVAQHNDDYTEAWPEFNKRCHEALDRAATSAMSGENVIVFTSCGIIAAICRNILGLSAEQMVGLMWEISNASVTRITCKQGRYSINAFNATAHLDRTCKPELITIK